METISIFKSEKCPDFDIMLLKYIIDELNGFEHSGNALLVPFWKNAQWLERFQNMPFLNDSFGSFFQCIENTGESLDIFPLKCMLLIPRNDSEKITIDYNFLMKASLDLGTTSKELAAGLSNLGDNISAHISMPLYYSRETKIFVKDLLLQAIFDIIMKSYDFVMNNQKKIDIMLRRGFLILPDDKFSLNFIDDLDMAREKPWRDIGPAQLYFLDNPEELGLENFLNGPSGLNDLWKVYVAGLAPLTQENLKVFKIVKSYHALKKDTCDTTLERIDLLKKIVLHCGQISCASHPRLAILEAMAAAKAGHLNAINESCSNKDAKVLDGRSKEDLDAAQYLRSATEQTPLLLLLEGRNTEWMRLELDGLILTKPFHFERHRIIKGTDYRLQWIDGSKIPNGAFVHVQSSVGTIYVFPQDLQITEEKKIRDAKNILLDAVRVYLHIEPVSIGDAVIFDGKVLQISTFCEGCKIIPKALQNQPEEISKLYRQIKGKLIESLLFHPIYWIKPYLHEASLPNFATPLQLSTLDAEREKNISTGFSKAFLYGLPDNLTSSMKPYTDLLSEWCEKVAIDKFKELFPQGPSKDLMSIYYNACEKDLHDTPKQIVLLRALQNALYSSTIEVERQEIYSLLTTFDLSIQLFIRNWFKISDWSNPKSFFCEENHKRLFDIAKILPKNYSSESINSLAALWKDSKYDIGAIKEYSKAFRTFFSSADLVDSNTWTRYKLDPIVHRFMIDRNLVNFLELDKDILERLLEETPDYVWLDPNSDRRKSVQETLKSFPDSRKIMILPRMLFLDGSLH